MEKYINVLKCIVKNFNIIENNEFDDIIFYLSNIIIDKIFDNYDKNSYFIKKFF